MNGRYRVPAPFAVVLGIILVMFGLFNLFCNLDCIYQNEKFKRNADKVIAECTDVVDDTNSSHSYLKTTVSFLYNGKKYENVVIDNYGQCILLGEHLDLYVNKDNPTQCVIEYSSTEGTGQTHTIFSIAGLVSGAVMIIVGISRIKQKIKSQMNYIR